MMDIYFPKYYKNFKCIADKCKNSCCVGWEIGVDAETMEKYKRLSGAENTLDILSHVEHSEYGSILRLDECERCPFLDGSGLCKIISSLGEEYISEICREHPRFYHSVSGRVEGGIGAVCEEACRLILSSDDYGGFVMESVNEKSISCETDFDIFADRNSIFDILCKENITFRNKIDQILSKYSVDIEIIKDALRDDVLSELEFLDESHRELFRIEDKCDVHTDEYLSRFLAYLVYRHVSVATDKENLRARVGFSVLLALVLEALANGCEDFSGICFAARIISEEIEYSEDNTAALIFEIESSLL